MGSKLSAWDFKQYEELFTDELIEEAINELLRNYSKMSKWLKENTDYFKCEKCNSEDLYYRHDGILCNDCDYIEKIKVPYPVKGGVVTSRKLTSCIKQIFGSRMGQARKNEKPSKKTLKSLKYDLYSFDTGEYTPEEEEFLTERFNDLMKQAGKEKGSDPSMIRAMVIQELVLINIQRRIAVGEDIDTLDKKREYDLYKDLSSQMKFSKNTRENEDEQDSLSRLISKNEELEEDLDIDEDIKNFIKQYEKVEEYKKDAKVRREEVGNPYG